jgi:hypothetical protein
VDAGDKRVLRHIFHLSIQIDQLPLGKCVR